MLLVRQYRVVEVLRLETDAADIVGWGETLPHYTWGDVSEDAIQRVLGKPLAELVGDDSLGAGLQMAIYDAAGKAFGVPVWRLFHLPKVRDYAPIAWWNTKMPPEILAQEAQEAAASGYIAHKIKLRPWFDIYEQIKAITEATPPHYAIEPDFNDMLLTGAQAGRVLHELDKFEKIALYEGPIPQRDIAGYQHLRTKTNRPIAIHFGLPPFRTAVEARMCDGFVLNEGVVATLKQGQLCEVFEMPFFLQLTGAGLTTALMTHLAAVLPFARWPAITGLNNYADDLLAEPLRISAGQIRVSDAPGLGVDFEESALTKYAMTPPYSVPPPRHIITIRWQDGRKIHYPYLHRPGRDDGPAFSHLRHGSGVACGNSAPGAWEDALMGNLPFFERGVTLNVWDDDSSPEWNDLHRRVSILPVRE